MTSYFLASVTLGYAGMATVMPFEVAKTLLQVQWIPKGDLDDVMEQPEEMQTAPGHRDEDEVCYSLYVLTP